MSEHPRLCEDVRSRVVRGELSADAEDHLLACSSCAAFSVWRLEEPLTGVPAQLDAVLDAVEGRITQERGLVALLRSRPTWQRWWMAVGSSLLLLTAAGVLGSGMPALGLPKLLMLGGCLAASALVLRELLSPAHLPEQPRMQHALGGIALGVPALIAALHVVLPDANAPARAGCLSVGLAVAFTWLWLLRALDRSVHRSRGNALLAVAAAGLLGNLALALYCPGTQASHLLVWHAPVGLLVAACYLRWAARVARTAR